MNKFIHNSWEAIMNHERNPLRVLTDLNTRHMIMQVLAWMWCIMFSMYFGSMWVFGFTAIAHVLIIAAIVITVATFKSAESMNWKFRTPSRARTMYHNGQRITLDKNDVGGEHE